MTAGHHNASASDGDSVEDQYRRGDLTCVLQLATRVDNRLDAGAYDTVGARPKVAGDNHCAARMNIANAQQIPERSFDIDVGFEVGDVFDQAAQSAGAKGQRDWRVIEERSRCGYSWFGHSSYLHASLAFRPAMVRWRHQQGSLYVSKRLNKSMGTGKIMVELLSADTSTRLCRNLRCMAAGCFAMISAASASFCEA